MTDEPGASAEGEVIIVVLRLLHRLHRWQTSRLVCTAACQLTYTCRIVHIASDACRELTEWRDVHVFDMKKRGSAENVCTPPIHQQEPPELVAKCNETSKAKFTLWTTGWNSPVHYVIRLRGHWAGTNPPIVVCFRFRPHLHMWKLLVFKLDWKLQKGLSVKTSCRSSEAAWLSQYKEWCINTKI